MLRVVRTEAAWRDLPDRFRPWQTVHGRYRRRRQAGIWPRVFNALEQQDPAQAP